VLFNTQQILIRLGLWGMTEYSAILVIEPVSVVVQGIEHLFELPTQFAYGAAQQELEVNGTKDVVTVTDKGIGIMLLHPCAAVYDHMLQLLNDHPSLRFHDRRGEQRFIEWYFKSDSLTLPTLYKAHRTRMESNSQAAILSLQEFMNYSTVQIRMLASYPNHSVYIEPVLEEMKNNKSINYVRSIVACKV
jgi:hypothetical protein